MGPNTIETGDIGQSCFGPAEARQDTSTGSSCPICGAHSARPARA